MKEKSIKFNSHKELDDFVNNIIINSFEFLEDYPQENFILRSFDRAFWLKHFKDSENEIYKPCNCPYQDPSNNINCFKKFFF
jgi:hypothetical protein